MKPLVSRWAMERLGEVAAPLAERRKRPEDPVGKYRILRELGRGAMGTVYEAEDTQLQRRVALKILQDRPGASELLRQRFRREAMTAARIDHPNAVKVFDAGEDRGRTYLVMELVEGESLREFLAGGRRDVRDALRLLEKVARGVAAAHAAGVVHRDVKPANILVTREGEPKVGDFGLAHWLDSDTVLTKSGSPVGTPMYMAPEQVSGRPPVSPATDVYALGAILYEILASRPPFAGENTAEIYSQILGRDPAPPRRFNSKVGADLETVCLKALEKDSRHRYPTALELAEDLARHLRGEPVSARPVSKTVRIWRRAARQRAVVIPVAAALLVSAAVGGWAIVSSVRHREETVAREEAGRLLDSAKTLFDPVFQGLYLKDFNLEERDLRLAECRRRIDDVIARRPGLAPAQLLLGRAWSLEGRSDRAEEAFRKAIDLDPRLGPAHHELGRVLLERAYLAKCGVGAPRMADAGASSIRQRDEAVARFREAISLGDKLEGDLPRRLADVALLYLEDRYDEGHLQALKEAGRFAGIPGAEDFLWLAGEMIPGQAAALGLYDRVLLIRPTHPMALFTRGTMHLVAGRWDAAIADLSLQVRVSRGNVWALLNLGMARLARGDWDGALVDFRGALALDAGLAPVHQGIGYALRGKGERDGALAAYEEALRLDPDLPNSYQERGLLRAERGMTAEAAADFREVLRLAEPGSPLRERAERELHRCEEH